MARYSAVFVFYNRKSEGPAGTPTGGRKLNLLPEEPIESFWDALWLGIEPFLCFIWLSIPTDIRVSRFTFGSDGSVCTFGTGYRFTLGSCETVPSLRFRFGSRL